MSVDDKPQSLIAHLDELRWRLLKAAIAILVGAVIAFAFADPLRSIIESPFNTAAPDSELQAFAVAEKWGVLMRISFFGGVIIASPFVLYQIWAFINPALTTRERRWTIPMISAMAALFVGGVIFGYWVFPRGLDFLLNRLLEDVATDLRIGEYYSFALRFLFAFGVAFLYPVFIFAAAAAGIVTSQKLARWRQWAVLVVVVGAALITPTGDALTLMLLSVPLYLMYEITYWLVRLVLRK